MNRRDFLSFSFRAAAGFAALSLLPFSLIADSTFSKISEQWTWHGGRAAWLYMAQCQMFGKDYYCADFVGVYDTESVASSRRLAVIAFKRRAAIEMRARR